MDPGKAIFTFMIVIPYTMLVLAIFIYLIKTLLWLGLDISIFGIDFNLSI